MTLYNVCISRMSRESKKQLTIRTCFAKLHMSTTPNHLTLRLLFCWSMWLVKIHQWDYPYNEIIQPWPFNKTLSISRKYEWVANTNPSHKCNIHCETMNHAAWWTWVLACGATTLFQWAGRQADMCYPRFTLHHGDIRQKSMHVLPCLKLFTRHHHIVIGETVGKIEQKPDPAQDDVHTSMFMFSLSV